MTQVEAFAEAARAFMTYRYALEQSVLAMEDYAHNRNVRHAQDDYTKRAAIRSSKKAKKAGKALRFALRAYLAAYRESTRRAIQP